MTGSKKRSRTKKNTWYFRVEAPRNADGTRDQRTRTVRATDAKDADRQLREFVEEIENGVYAEGGRQTFAAIATKWLDARAHRVGARAYANYIGHVNHYIVPALGPYKAEKLRPVHIETALASWMTSSNGRRKVPTPVSARTVAHVFATLRSILRWAVEMDLIARDCSIAVKPPRVPKTEMRYLDGGGIGDLLEAVRSTDLEYPVILALGTGLRLGEILGLRWSDIDLDPEAPKLKVRRSVETVDGVTRTKEPKTASSRRTISLPGFVVDALRGRKAQQNESRLLLGLGRREDSSVFARADESAWSPHVLSTTFSRAVKASGLRHVRFHDLRHTYATQSLAAGVDLKTVSMALGHSSISVTANIYLHAVESLNEDAASRIDARLGWAVNDGLSRPRSETVGDKTVIKMASKPRKSP